MYVRPDRQPRVRPPVISHGTRGSRVDRSRFRLEFDWMGTDDPTAFLCVPESIRFIGSLLPGGWTEIMQRNHALVVRARGLPCEALGEGAPAPETMLGSLAALLLPPDLRGSVSPGRVTDPLQDTLLEEFQIEVPVFPWIDPARVLRVSAQVYNTLDEYKRLADALVALRKRPPRSL